ncbi:DUF7662 domain-containing protein [Cetobacterium sp.]|uniref:DUF7662 domain-containing protein n=1 Tax=Cetobacterium sp. TaxID=2071632 RepID=UPI003EE68EDB
MKKYNYQRLINFLNNQTDVNVRITYAQMEELLERELPKSAYKFQAYFANDKTHHIPRIWLELGYKKIELVLGEYLVLKKLKK